MYLLYLCESSYAFVFLVLIYSSTYASENRNFVVGVVELAHLWHIILELTIIKKQQICYVMTFAMIPNH